MQSESAETSWNRRLLIACLAAAMSSGMAATAVRSAGEDRPNFLWITCEDLSPMLGCYGDPHARTPNLDRLARQSVRFTRAFAPSPVCSPARTSLIFGRHATTLGASNHRSRPLTPPEVIGFPAHLRDAGYFSSNHTKLDYNTSRLAEVKQACFDSDGDWRDRPRKDQPFLSIINFMTTHASHGTVWPYRRYEQRVRDHLGDEDVHDPADAPLPPYYPDTPIARRTIARYYDCATRMDQQVGQVLSRLEEDGLAEDTIVFFFSDHGTGLPRHKQTALDTGLRVPLLIRFPDKWQHVAPAAPGETCDRLVTFEDFGPSLLDVASIPIPDYMHGRPFLSRDPVEPNQVLFASRDRLDEAYDAQRSLRDERFRYLRNLMPHLPHVQHNRYLQTSEFFTELIDLHVQEGLEGPAAALMAPRAAEELYDIANDPHELNNLAEAPEFAHVVEAMRLQLRDQMLRLPDLCLVPEFELERRAGDRPLAALADEPGKLPLERIIAAATLVGMGAEVIEAQAEALRDEDNVVRWWAVLGLRNQDPTADTVRVLLRASLEDSSPLVAGEAALALIAIGELEEAVPVFRRLLAKAPDEETTYLARSSVYAGHRETLLPLIEAAASDRSTDLGFDQVMVSMRALEGRKSHSN